MSVELLTVSIALCVSFIVYSLFKPEESFIHQRLKKTSSKRRMNTFFRDIANILRPVSESNLKNYKSKNKIQTQLYSLNFSSSEDDVLDFENQRLFIFIFVLVIAIACFVFYPNMMCGSIGALACYMAYKMPEFKLQRMVKKKQKEFMKYFSDALDLLAVCVEAGLGIDAAIERVSVEFSQVSKVVSSEFTRLSMDIISGQSREDALRSLAKRIDSQDLKSFCALLIQSDKMGTSIANSLYVYCDTMRTRKRQRIEELVQSASTKMTIPMILFLLPALFIVIMYPAIMKIMENMTGKF